MKLASWSSVWQNNRNIIGSTSHAIWASTYQSIIATRISSKFALILIQQIRRPPWITKCPVLVSNTGETAAILWRVNVQRVIQVLLSAMPRKSVPVGQEHAEHPVPVILSNGAVYGSAIKIAFWIRRKSCCTTEDCARTRA